MSTARSLVAVAVGTMCVVLAVIRDAAALNPTRKPSNDPRHTASSAFTRREPIGRLFAVIPQTDDFASGNQISVVSGTAEVNLDPAGAYDNTYTAHYYVQVTLSSPGFDPYVALTVAIDANDGSGWVERATFLYERFSSGTSTWSHEQKAIVVSGLGPNDDIRLRAKSFVKFDANGSFAIRGGDAGGSNPETYNGVTYATSADPVVDVTPYNYAKQDYGRCAVACFAAVHHQSTTPYFSLDAPRFVTLVYNSDRVNPRPFVHVNVSPAVAFPETPTEYRLEVKVNGAFVTFLNGEQTLRFAYPGAVTARIGGQFDAASYATGVYPMNILVTAVYPIAGVSTKDIATKFVVVNEASSLFGAGWTLAGIERLFLQSDSSALITEGDGSAVYFARVGGAYVSPAGDFSQLVTGTPGGGAGWTRRYPDSTKVAFNTNGRMTEVRDRFNNSSAVIYDAFNRVYQIKDPLDLTTTLTYDGWGFLDYISDPMGRATQVTVNASNRLTFIQDPDLIGTQFGYDSNNRLNTIVDRRGFVTTLSYDPQSAKVTTITAPSISYVGTNGADSTGSPVTTLSAWQKVGVPYTSTASTPATASLADTVYGRVTDPGTHTSRFTVNQWGTPTVATDALGRTDSTRFDMNGLPIRVRASTGGVDSAAYNGIGLPTYLKASGRPATILRYAAWAQADSVRTEDGLSGARYFIGTNGRVDSILVAGGTPDAAKTRIRYDNRGRPDSVIDPVGHLVRRTWYAGPNGNRSKDSLPGGRVTTYGYDAYGRDTSVIRPGLAGTRTFYSIINRPDSVRDGVNPVPIRYGYDNVFLTSVTDSKGQVYGFTYNALGWITQRTDPLGHADGYKYSRDGELRRWTNRRGQSIDYGFDALHRRTSKSGTNTATESWAYPADTVVVATSLVAVDTTIANRHGQILRVSTGMVGQTYVRRYTYTAAGALDSVIPSGAGIVFQARQYTWNLRRGTLTNIKLGAGPVSTALTYTTDGLAASVTFPGGDQVTRGYTSTHATAGITTTASYSATVNRASGLDIANRIQRHIVTTNTGHQFSYDSLGRLKADSSMWRETPCNPGPPFQEDGDNCAWSPNWVVTGGTTFQYDSAGNRRDLNGTYTLGNRITAFNGCTYVTDPLEGNVTTRTCGGQTVAFAWTAENRLASLTVGGQTTTFDYNAAGQLIKKTTGGVARYFLWERGNVLAELDAAGTGKIAEYSYYPGLDNLHALIVGSTNYHAHRDMLANVIALTDEAGAVQRWYEFDSWGNVTGSADYANFAGKDRARFKGALWVGDETELYYMRNRWYEPRSGRFLSEDPIGIQGGVNPYVYAGNDPVNHRDPSGLLQCAIDEFCHWDYYGLNQRNPYANSDPSVAGGGGGGGSECGWLVVVDGVPQGCIDDLDALPGFVESLGLIWPAWHGIVGHWDPKNPQPQLTLLGGGTHGIAGVWTVRHRGQTDKWPQDWMPNPTDWAVNLNTTVEYYRGYYQNSTFTIRMEAYGIVWPASGRGWFIAKPSTSCQCSGLPLFDPFWP